MNKLRAESIPEEVIAGASALVLTSYLVRCKPGEPMPDATMKAIEYAKKYNVPVVLTLGTKFVIADNPEWWQAFLKEHVSILAMNEEEAEALTGESDPLLASDKALDWVDWCSAPPGQSGCTWQASRKKRASVKPSTRCCRAQSPNLTSMSSAALCVIKTASTRCVSSLTSHRIWVALRRS